MAQLVIVERLGDNRGQLSDSDWNGGSRNEAIRPPMDVGVEREEAAFSHHAPCVLQSRR